jgi:hypothetical protein
MRIRILMLHGYVCVVIIIIIITTIIIRQALGVVRPVLALYNSVF